MSDKDLFVFSHLRWTWVWQRPQHLISRLADYGRIWFVEEPLPAPVAEPVLRTEDRGGVTRVWLEVPVAEEWVGFDHPCARSYPEELSRLVEADQDRAAWLYTPMALPLAQALNPTVVVYDVMDDLASFKGASAGMALARRRALQQADVVFTGGRSLHAAAVERRPTGAHLFPSGVEPEHYACAMRVRALRGPQSRPVAGYVGVLDERLDYELLGDLAARLPDWTIRMVGPVAKIDPASLPARSNLEYTGPCDYARLPEMMGGFDVALMPFALNEATRSISPTKTLEYLAAGLPVVSTRVPDVVADYRGLVELEDDAEGFAAACRRVTTDSPERQGLDVGPLLHRQHWNSIAARMSRLVEQAWERNVEFTDADDAESQAVPAS